MVNSKKILKFVGILILALFVLYLGAEVGFQVKYRLELWKTEKAMEEFNKSIAEMFEADTFGGKTPEQTFDLFVDALKNENVDLAVKYIVLDIERRQKYYDEFNEMKQNGELKEYIENWPKWEDWSQTKDNYTDWENRAEAWYAEEITEITRVYDPYIKEYRNVKPGRYIQESIVFIKNQNNIWKIESF